MATTVSLEEVSKPVTNEEIQGYLKEELLNNLKFYQRDMAEMQRLKQTHPELKPNINPIIADLMIVIQQTRQQLEGLV